MDVPRSRSEIGGELKARFPNLKVKVFDAGNTQSKTIELAAA
jgi:hypothetical protein